MGLKIEKIEYIYIKLYQNKTKLSNFIVIIENNNNNNNNNL
jgi:hypothetical protein